MKTLSIDVSHKQILIGIHHEDGFQILIDQILDKAELLPYLLSESLKKTHINIDSIQKMGIITGPGNYTSLRAGMLMARSLAMFNHMHVFPKNRLEVMLYLAAKKHNRDVMAIQNVRQNQYYTAIGRYADDQVIYSLKPDCLDEEALKILKQSHPIEDTIGDSPGIESDFNSAQKIVEALGEWSHRSAYITAFNKLVPFYIRPAVAEKK